MTTGAAPPRTASILAVGSELLGTTRLDTNSLFLTGRMDALGIATVRKACVGDGWDDLVAEIQTALERASLLVTSGGLGPTDDDRTKEAVAKVLGRRLVRDEEILSRLKERFRKRGYAMPDVNAKQADVVEGATVLVNRRGSAPGFLVEEGGRTVVLLPGVPHELKAMWDDAVAPLLARAGEPGLHRRVLKVAAMPESVVETMIKPVYAAHPSVPITILAAPGEVQLQFASRGTAGEAAAVLDRIEADFRRALGDEIFGRDDDTLEGAVGGLLRAKGKTLALAESCTGGLLAGRLTDVAGSSDYFLGAAVTYANAAKTDLAGVSAETLERYGAVSEETAREMALGARLRFGSSIGVSVTGIAGPGGGTPEKPVGTVHLALDDADGTRLHRRLATPGDRALIRRWTTSSALSLLRHHLLGTSGWRA
ncbi:MAG TPA: competence/damage-inducible protein A [Thermoanaerobaculia bacterium]|nr:competence/damage-inducible protein A [Thermoanaerobaculia bacterium]